MTATITPMKNDDNRNERNADDELRKLERIRFGDDNGGTPVRRRRRDGDDGEPGGMEKSMAADHRAALAQERSAPLGAPAHEPRQDEQGPSDPRLIPDTLRKMWGPVAPLHVDDAKPKNPGTDAIDLSGVYINDPVYQFMQTHDEQGRPIDEDGNVIPDPSDDDEDECWY
ncbi:hypothetical protein OZX67_09330 [Bifidobacterium sp. ESL0728]|uniref:hypothetical protein n=1 Tax=Bifidobacterium sp. ESL0728 TaxID=2983220 RepID=UPI0023F6DD0F|nr:hypothetical protein [Bifidobacterium sp. ESL0728]WEV58968.1 hypothetical protein OZX67_09330 [Bifidobacterium sp. ESL0728]